MSRIYKLLSRQTWAEAKARGVFEGSAVDLADGFIHFSTADQAQETARRHFQGQADIVVVGIEAEALGDRLVWEPSRGGALFPHLYEPLPTALAVFEAEAPLGPEGYPVIAALDG